MPKSRLKRVFLGISLTTFSESVISKIQNQWGSSLFSQHSKFQLDFENAAKKREKAFILWDYCIWIGIVKFSLLRTGYLSLGANVLRSSQRFYMLIIETFFDSIDFAVINEYDKGAVIQIPTLLGHVYHVACRRVLSNGAFWQLSNHVFGVCNFEIQNLWGSSFLSKYLKFNLDLKNAAKNWEKVFFCRDNYIWIGIVKFSLLRTGYFSPAANVLTSSPKNLHVNNRDSFQLNWIRSDQGRW